MAEPQLFADDSLAEPQFDDNGVDLAQIREMLDLTPTQRLMVISSSSCSA